MGPPTIAKVPLAVYAAGRQSTMSPGRIADTPFSWAAAGFVIGLALGVTAVSVWLLAIGLGGFLLYLRLHGPAQHKTEGRLFAAGPVFLISWVLGFVVRGIAF